MLLNPNIELVNLQTLFIRSNFAPRFIDVIYIPKGNITFKENKKLKGAIIIKENDSFVCKKQKKQITKLQLKYTVVDHRARAQRLLIENSLFA